MRALIGVSLISDARQWRVRNTYGGKDVGVLWPEALPNVATDIILHGGYWFGHVVSWTERNVNLILGAQMIGHKHRAQMIGHKYRVQRYLGLRSSIKHFFFFFLHMVSLKEHLMNEKTKSTIMKSCEMSLNVTYSGHSSWWTLSDRTWFSSEG